MRKERKLDLAKRWLNGLEGAYERRRESEEHTVWSWWAVRLLVLVYLIERQLTGSRPQDGRAELRSTMLEDAYSKRRKLDREKRNMDRPKDGASQLGFLGGCKKLTRRFVAAGGLSPFLAPRPLPVVPLQHRRRVGFDGDVLTENEIAWALRHPDLRTDASVSALDDDSTWSDLERMGVRRRSPVSSIVPLCLPDDLLTAPRADPTLCIRADGLRTRTDAQPPGWVRPAFSAWRPTRRSVRLSDRVRLGHAGWAPAPLWARAGPAASAVAGRAPRLPGPRHGRAEFEDRKSVV